MKLKLIWTLPLVIALLGGSCGNYLAPELGLAQSRRASVEGPSASTTAERRVDRIFAGYANTSSPGCTLGMIQDGNFVYRKGYGMGSLELGVPLSSQSVVYMGSVSKQFTAASIVLAAERGFLKLDDNVRKYIPELPDYGQPITLLEMLHHTSGLPDTVGMLGIAGRHAEDVHPTAELMDLIIRQKALNFTPGEQYLYSNTNYFLLAQVLKRATGQSLPEFAAENIFMPLGMTHTRFYDDRTAIVPGRVAAYTPGQHGNFLVDWSTNFDMVGAGGLMSSVDDLLLWDRNFYGNKLGKGTLLKEMLTRAVLNNGKESNYALGLTMGAYRGSPTVEHDGANFGYRTEILRFPQQRFTALVLCNVSTADPDDLAHEVADIYLENELQPLPKLTLASGFNPAAIAGKYFDTQRHFPVSFVAENGKLMLQGHVLYPAGANRYEDPVIGGTATFSNSNGAMKAVVTYNDAITFSGARIEDLRLDDAALAAYAGTYKSAALDATYTLSVESGNLVLRTNWNPAINFQPVVPDEFYGGGMTLSFRRDNTNHFSGLSVFSGWDALIRNEGFKKLN